MKISTLCSRFAWLTILWFPTLLPGQPEIDIPAAARAADEAAQQGQYPEAAEILERQLAKTPEAPRLWLDLANYQFMAGDLDRALKSYDRLLQITPSSRPFLWQRGLALYYADQFAEGRAQFETHQDVNSADVENAVWHLLCVAREEDLATAREKMIPIRGDRRVPMSEVYQLFAGKASPENVLAAARSNPNWSEDQVRRHEYYAYLYIGLFHEMNREPEASRAAMQKAVRLNPWPGNTLMGQIARLHLELRTPKK